ncbi:MAG TPA: site-specific integrase [Nitrososphaerales archaeon]|nr:site-specific integrase [Nitrososphaerales archaeon]
MAAQQEEETSVGLFIRSLRTPKTARAYEQALRLMFNGDPESFLERARKDKKAAEDELMQWIFEAKARYSGSTIRTWLAAVRSFTEFAELPTPLNWKKIIKTAPKTSVSQDRPVSIEEIRQIFTIADLRFKFVISLLASSGIRVGAFDYFTLKDLKPLEIESGGHFEENKKKTRIGVLRVYAGEPEQYTTFVCSESMDLFEAYCEERKRAGEVLTPDSPLVRNPVNFKHKSQVLRTSSESVAFSLNYLWRKVGLKTREFKAVHGFRKFFKTTLEGAGMKSIVVEALMGHLSQLDTSYYRPSTQSLAQEYAKHQSVLFIDPALSLKQENAAIITEARSAITSRDAEVALLREKVNILSDTLNRMQQVLEEIKSRSRQSV